MTGRTAKGADKAGRPYIEMGNAAGDPLCWYFWGRAGLSKEDLLRVTPRLQERLRVVRVWSRFALISQVFTLVFLQGFSPLSASHFT